VTELRLGTRGSQLALWQANAVASRIADAGGPSCRIVVIKTTGDRLQTASLSDAGGKRLFVKEIEEALLAGEVDLAVHSSKDMPAILAPGLVIAGVLPREDPHDAIVLPAMVEGSGLMAQDNRAHQPYAISHQPSAMTTVRQLIDALGESPSIGTGSVRRIAQLARLFPGARFTAIRGNLDTRLRKLDEGAHDALVLAAAGLRRLGFGYRVSLAVPAEACLPAPGQGIVAIEIRDGDARVREAVARTSDPAAAAALVAERALVQALGAGCQTPVGALAVAVGDDELELAAGVFALDGSRAVRGTARAPRDEAAALGARVGAQLLRDGAGEILADAAQGVSRRAQVASRDADL
jgi:hydroxymethylbilane synthase